MATLTWTPADGFTRKTRPVVTKPMVTEKPKPPPAQPKPKRPKPSVIQKQRAYWLKQNRLSPNDYTIADQYLVKQAKTATPREFHRFICLPMYLVKQAKTATPMVFIGYGRVYPCTVVCLWRYDLDLTIEGHKHAFLCFPLLYLASP